MGRFDKTIIPLALVGYEKIIVSSAIRTSLAIHHSVGDPHLELGGRGGGGVPFYFACSTDFSSSCDFFFFAQNNGGLCPPGFSLDSPLPSRHKTKNNTSTGV